MLGSIHIGFVKALAELSHFKPRTLVGTSVGSIINFFIAIGLTHEEMKKAFFNMNTSILKFKQVHNIFSELGMDDGEYFVAYMYDILLQRCLQPTMTFQELWNARGIELVVVVTDIVSYKTMYLSRHTYPDFEIVQALRASCTIPLLVTPMYGPNGEMWVDGGVTENYPVSHVTTKQGGVVGCNLVAWKPAPLYSLQDYVLNLVGCVFRHTAEDGPADTITLTVDCSDISFFDFDQDLSTREMLVERGYTLGKDYLKRGNLNVTKASQSRRRHSVG